VRAHCIRKGSECKYDIEEGLTSQQDLRTRLSSAQEELAQMKSLVHELRYTSDTCAVQLLSRLRMGEEVAWLLDAGQQYSNR